MGASGDRSAETQHAALDEFTQENRPSAAGKMEQPGGSLFVVTRAVPVLDPRPAALSRVESVAKRRAKRRRARFTRLAAHAAAWRARFLRLAEAVRSETHRGSSALRKVLALATQKSSSAAAASRRTMRRTSARLRERMRPVPSPVTVTAFGYQESNGFVVAVLLGMAVVGYGSFLVGSWRAPSASVTRAATWSSGAATQRPTAPAAVAPSPAIATAGISIARPVTRTSNPLAGTPRAAVKRSVSFTPNARTLTAMWQRRDTRSLDQAFNSLRRQTLAFHRCGMRVLDTDRAVARCEGVATAGTQASRAATWTIDFQRTAGRWIIARVATS